jgi:tripartite-type tricarboxylate transporter receptor subunit TctC
MITRRAIVQGLACATLLGGSGIARAQAFPDKVVKIIVPLPPGSPPDVLARVVGEGLSKLWKQPVVVENRPGGTGSVGMQALVRSPADGYTVGIMFLTHTVIPELMGPLSYNTATDIEPIGNAVWLYNVLTVPAASPIRSLQDLVDRARAQPGALTYGSGGNGSPAHLVAESFCQATQTKMLHVPFRGPAEAVTALIGDQLSTMFATVSTAAPLIKAERLRALAVTSPERMSAMPNVPTLKEAGVSGLELKEWEGFVAPAGTPKALIAKWNQDVFQVLAQPEVRSRLAELGMTVAERNRPEEFGGLVRKELEHWGGFVRSRGLKPS